MKNPKNIPNKRRKVDIMEQSDSEEQLNGHSEPENNDSDSPSKPEKSTNLLWASVMAKVLTEEKPKNKKYLVLSKFKKPIDKSNGNTKLTFEIDGEQKEDKPETNNSTDSIDNKETGEEEKPNKYQIDRKIKHKRIKNDRLFSICVKPDQMDKDHERQLKRIATRGCVQLFNAVRQHQKELKQKLIDAGPLDHKRDAVLNNMDKKKFLDTLMGGKRSKSELVGSKIKDEQSDDEDITEPPSHWNVLRDDFMTNKKLANWNKKEDSDTEDEYNESDDDQVGGSDESD